MVPELAGPRPEGAAKSLFGREESAKLRALAGACPGPRVMNPRQVQIFLPICRSGYCHGPALIVL